MCNTNQHIHQENKKKDVDGSWSCAKCTFEVSAGYLACPMCDNLLEDISFIDEDRPRKNRKVMDTSSSSEAEFDFSNTSSDEKPCPRCTVINSSSETNCKICEFEFAVRTTYAASSSSSASFAAQSKTGLSKRKPWCKFCATNDHWSSACCEKISADEETLSSQTYTDGVVDLLQHALRKQHSDTSGSGYYYLSSPCSFITQKGTVGAKWSCGYRNIQMLCSALMNIPAYKEVLFDGR